jgi:hypothetical protein
VFEKRVLGRISGMERDEVKKDEVGGGWENRITRSCMICTLPQV